MGNELSGSPHDLERLIQQLSERGAGTRVGDRSGLPASLAHLRRARVVELKDGDEEKEAGGHEKDQQEDSDSAGDSASSDSDSDDSDKETSNVDISQVIGIIQSVADTLKGGQASFDDKLSSMVHLQTILLKMNDKKRGKIGKHVISSGLLDIWGTLVKNTATGGVSGARSERNSKWKMMEMIYLLLVKITDKSSAFSQQVASTDLFKHTIGVLKSQQHQDLCAHEPFLSATSWMIELIGNCYGGLEETNQQDECHALVEIYLQVNSESIQIKAGQTKLAIALRGQLGPATSGMASSQSTRKNKSPKKKKKVATPPPVVDSDEEASSFTFGQEDSAEDGDSSSHEETLHRLLSGLLGGLEGLGGLDLGDLGMGDLGGLGAFGLGAFGLGKDNEDSKEAERMCRKGMPIIYTEDIKAWFGKPDRWLAFNRDDKMWESLHENFKAVVKYSKASTVFCEALCEAGILGILQDILSNSQIQEASMGNPKTREVATASVLVILYASRLENARKYIDVTRIWDLLQGYLISDDINMRGHAILIVASIAKLDDSVGNFNMSFSSEDIQLMVATYMAYKEQGRTMGDFLALTNFPEVCVQEVRNRLTRDRGNEVIQDDEWRHLTPLLGAMLGLSKNSEEFAKSLARANIVEPVQTALSSRHFRAREEEKHCGHLLKISVLLVLNCVRVADPAIQSGFLVPNLWPHIYHYTTIRRTEEIKHLASFLAFAHMHALVSDGTSRQVTIDKFPQLNRAAEDILYINRVWNITNTRGEQVLGDYLAATGGAAVHVALLGDLVADLNTITSNENKEKFKPLLANMNNFAIRSSAFAEEMCRNNVLEHLNKILANSGLNLPNDGDEENKLVHHSVSTVHACAQYSPNMPYFRSTDIGVSLCKFMTGDLPAEIKVRAMKAVIFIRRHAPEQIDPIIAQQRVSAVTENDLVFYQQLHRSCEQDNIGIEAGALLIELGVAETMGRKMKQLVQEKLLLSSYAITQPLLNCLWNFTDNNREFTMVMRDVGIFETCQEIIRNPEYKDNLNDEKVKEVISSSLSILLNSAQFEANHSALSNLRVLNDLLQFTKASNLEIRIDSILIMCFLTREEHANLVRSSSDSKVVRFLLNKLKAAIEDERHRSDGYRCAELLGGLSGMALNDSNKANLVYDGILPILARILVKGDVMEKLLAVNLTWTLTFQEDNKYYVQEELALMDALKNLSEKGDSELKIRAKGVMCLLGLNRDRIYRELEKRTRQRPDSAETLVVDVFLSHHPKSGTLFSQIKNQLEADGFKVMTLNHDSQSDDMFAQMTSSIEKSKMVIIEVSRQYQQSLFCRTEAEYSHSLLKPVVHLRCEHGFKPAGWLAKISMGRPAVDFSRNVTGNELVARMMQLMKEVKRCLRRGNVKE